MSKKQRDLRQAKIILEDGSEFIGWAFGKPHSVAGEVVFNTGMSGLIQVLTDPGCKGQIIVCTYPVVGNTGVPVTKNGTPFFDEYGLPINLESEKIHCAGLIVCDLCNEPSHYTCNLSLSAWLEKENIPGIFGIDTRALVIRLRERGTMRGKILMEGKLKNDFSQQSFGDVSINKINLSNHDGVSLNEIQTYKPKTGSLGIKIALIDCGVKTNIIRCLLNRGMEVIRIPCNHNFDNVDYNGLLISNGPGDPKEYKTLTENVSKVLSANKPVFGIGLGGAILSLAAGADSCKLPFGHRGQNQPSMEEGTNRCYVTPQNHGYTIRAESLPQHWKKWFVNANDGSIEGVLCENKPFSAVMFNPEGCPGSCETEFLFDRFISQVKEAKK